MKVFVVTLLYKIVIFLYRYKNILFYSSILSSSNNYFNNAYLYK